MDSYVSKVEDGINDSVPEIFDALALNVDGLLESEALSYVAWENEHVFLGVGIHLVYLALHFFIVKMHIIQHSSLV